MLSSGSGEDLHWTGAPEAQLRMGTIKQNTISVSTTNTQHKHNTDSMCRAPRVRPKFTEFIKATKKGDVHVCVFIKFASDQTRKYPCFSLPRAHVQESAIKLEIFLPYSHSAWSHSCHTPCRQIKSLKAGNTRSTFHSDMLD